MTRRLIVNADDFGRTRGVGQGILRAQRAGIVTSTTAMMNMPGVAQDLQQARTEAPDLGIGVHLNFTAGRPLLPPEWVGSLIDEHGHFLSQEAIQSNPMRINPDELKSELKSQINTFKNVMGVLPDHLDAHHFVHIHPHLFAVYLDLVTEFDLPARIPLPRSERDPGYLDQLPKIAANISQTELESLLHEDWQMLAQRSIRAPDRCVLSFFADEVSIAHLLHVLETLPDGVTELMTHPGLADDQLKAESPYNVQREQELGILTDPQVEAHVWELGIELATFAALK